MNLQGPLYFFGLKNKSQYNREEMREHIPTLILPNLTYEEFFINLQSLGDIFLNIILRKFYFLINVFLSQAHKLVGNLDIFGLLSSGSLHFLLIWPTASATRALVKVAVWYSFFFTRPCSYATVHHRWHS